MAKTEPKLKSNSQTLSVGRRKEAVARVRLFKGSGEVTVNGKPISQYFPGPIALKSHQRPFIVTDTLKEFYATIRVEGGGVSSQLAAVVHGLSRALAKVNPELYRISLKKEGLLTRDPRARERRKYGNAQKARAKKQSPKR